MSKNITLPTFVKVGKGVKIKKTPMSRNFDIDGLEDSILPNKTGFFLYVSGGAGSGKTSVILSLINNEYKKKFNRILLYSPSCHTIGQSIKLDESRFRKDLTCLEEDILEITDEYKEGLTNGEAYSTLIIVDDLIASIKKSDKVFKSLIFNRGHSNISVIATSQRYNAMPLDYRTNASHLIVFPTKNNRELTNVAEETDLFYNHKQFVKTLHYIFSEKYRFCYIDLLNGKMYKKFEEECIIPGYDDDEKEAEKVMEEADTDEEEE